MTLITREKSGTKEKNEYDASLLPNFTVDE